MTAPLLTVAEVAERLGMSRKGVAKWVRSGVFVGVAIFREGRITRLDADGFERWHRKRVFDGGGIPNAASYRNEEAWA